MNKLCCIIGMFITCGVCEAQIDLECNGRDLHSIYLHCYNLGGFYRIDSVDTNPTNPILLVPSIPSAQLGISINNNLDSIGWPETMYYVGGLGPTYYFWNGAGWTNTNHTSGGSVAINPGGTANYIFNLDGINNKLYRYDGTGNGTLLLSNLNSFNSTEFDVATDNQGNFYLFYTSFQKIIAYNPMGMAIDSFTTTGFPAGIQPGFSILGNRMYAIASNGVVSDLYEGIVTGSTINFTMIKNIALVIGDIATCPEAAVPLIVYESDTPSPITIYPNPFSKEVNIYISSNNITEVLFYDITLRIMLKQSFTNSTTINTEQLANGIYLYEVRNINGVIKNGKIVKD